jgi:hypothetical protein
MMGDVAKSWRDCIRGQSNVTACYHNTVSPIVNARRKKGLSRAFSRSIFNFSQWYRVVLEGILNVVPTSRLAKGEKYTAGSTAGV